MRRASRPRSRSRSRSPAAAATRSPTPSAPAKAPLGAAGGLLQEAAATSTRWTSTRRRGDFLLTTNRGFWRIAKDGSTVTPVKGTTTADGKTAPVGTFLEIRSTGPGQLLGSGHPDKPARCRTSSA